ncbi:MAG TPA: hypothetical protein VFK06_12515 [Candidatus Angelobacter sp.]|nr:hypothetical protein [Candidatus Angelobacter sp.]
MARQTTVASITAADACVAKLAEFFPNAVPARIPVQVMRVGGDSDESVVIEFGTADTVIFTSGLPLDFEDRVRLKNSDQSLNTEAEIVAMQFCSGKTAVAARFLGNVANWIIKG